MSASIALGVVGWIWVFICVLLFMGGANRPAPKPPVRIED